MAKIVDPDDLAQGVEITITPGVSGTISLNYESPSSIIPADGVTGQCIYSFLKEQWKEDGTLIKYPFPMIAITEEQFEMVNGWNWEDRRTARTIRDAGWSLKNAGGVSKQEWMNITTLGSFNAITDRAYYVQTIPTSSGTPSGFRFPDAVNEAVQIFAEDDHALGPQPHGIGGLGYDYRSVVGNASPFIAYLREEQKTYAIYDLLTEQGLTTVTYKKYALPLANASDTAKVTNTDTEIEADDPNYRHITVCYFPEAPYVKLIGSTNYEFQIVINADGQTAEEVYEKVQYLLRRTFNINGRQVPESQVIVYGNALETSGATLTPFLDGPPDPAGENDYYVRGDLAGSLLGFVGDTLQTKYVDGWGGTYIENFDANDINRLEFADNTDPSTLITYPFTATGNLLFNDNLVNDANANYWMFFTSIGASAYGTADAILVQDTDSRQISGAADSASIGFTFDYDQNDQPHGDPDSRTPATDADVTVVAIGLDTAQFVKTTATITRSTGNNISLVAALERNYNNP